MLFIILDFFVRRLRLINLRKDIFSILLQDLVNERLPTLVFVLELGSNLVPFLE